MNKSLIPYIISTLQIQGLIYVVFLLGLRKKCSQAAQVKIYIGLTAMLFITLFVLIYTLYINQMIKI